MTTFRSCTTERAQTSTTARRTMGLVAAGAFISTFAGVTQAAGVVTATDRDVHGQSVTSSADTSPTCPAGDYVLAHARLQKLIGDLTKETDDAVPLIDLLSENDDDFYQDSYDVSSGWERLTTPTLKPVKHELSADEDIVMIPPSVKSSPSYSPSGASSSSDWVDLGATFGGGSVPASPLMFTGSSPSGASSSSAVGSPSGSSFIPFPLKSVRRLNKGRSTAAPLFDLTGDDFSDTESAASTDFGLTPKTDASELTPKNEELSPTSPADTSAPVDLVKDEPASPEQGEEAQPLSSSATSLKSSSSGDSIQTADWDHIMTDMVNGRSDPEEGAFASDENGSEPSSPRRPPLRTPSDENSNEYYTPTMESDLPETSGSQSQNADTVAAVESENENSYTPTEVYTSPTEAADEEPLLAGASPRTEFFSMAANDRQPEFHNMATGSDTSGSRSNSPATSSESLQSSLASSTTGTSSIGESEDSEGRDAQFFHLRNEDNDHQVDYGTMDSASPLGEGMDQYPDTQEAAPRSPSTQSSPASSSSSLRSTESRPVNPGTGSRSRVFRWANETSDDEAFLTQVHEFRLPSSDSAASDEVDRVVDQASSSSSDRRNRVVRENDGGDGDDGSDFSSSSSGSYASDSDTESEGEIVNEDSPGNSEDEDEMVTSTSSSGSSGSTTTRRHARLPEEKRITSEGLEVTKREFLRMFGPAADWQRDAIPLYATRVSPAGLTLHYHEFLDVYGLDAWKMWWASVLPKEKRTAPDGKNYGKKTFHEWYGAQANILWAQSPRPSERRVDPYGKLRNKKDFIKNFGQMNGNLEWMRAPFPRYRRVAPNGRVLTLPLFIHNFGRQNGNRFWHSAPRPYYKRTDPRDGVRKNKQAFIRAHGEGYGNALWAHAAPLKRRNTHTYYSDDDAATSPATEQSSFSPTSLASDITEPEEAGASVSAPLTPTEVISSDSESEEIVSTAAPPAVLETAPLSPTSVADETESNYDTTWQDYVSDPMEVDQEGQQEDLPDSTSALVQTDEVTGFIQDIEHIAADDDSTVEPEYMLLPDHDSDEEMENLEASWTQSELARRLARDLLMNADPDGSLTERLLPESALLDASNETLELLTESTDALGALAAEEDKTASGSAPSTAASSGAKGRLPIGQYGYSMRSSQAWKEQPASSADAAPVQVTPSAQKLSNKIPFGQYGHGFLPSASKGQKRAIKEEDSSYEEPLAEPAPTEVEPEALAQQVTDGKRGRVPIGQYGYGLPLRSSKAWKSEVAAPVTEVTPHAQKLSNKIPFGQYGYGMRPVQKVKEEEQEEEQAPASEKQAMDSKRAPMPIIGQYGYGLPIRSSKAWKAEAATPVTAVTPHAQKLSNKIPFGQYGYSLLPTSHKNDESSAIEGEIDMFAPPTSEELQRLLADEPDLEEKFAAQLTGREYRPMHRGYPGSSSDSTGMSKLSMSSSSLQGSKESEAPSYTSYLLLQSQDDSSSANNAASSSSGAGSSTDLPVSLLRTDDDHRDPTPTELVGMLEEMSQLHAGAESATASSASSSSSSTSTTDRMIAAMEVARKKMQGWAKEVKKNLVTPVVDDARLFGSEVSEFGAGVSVRLNNALTEAKEVSNVVSGRVSEQIRDAFAQLRTPSTDTIAPAPNAGDEDEDTLADPNAANFRNMVAEVTANGVRTFVDSVRDAGAASLQNVQQAVCRQGMLELNVPSTRQNLQAVATFVRLEDLINWLSQPTLSILADEPADAASSSTRSKRHVAHANFGRFTKAARKQQKRKRALELAQKKYEKASRWNALVRALLEQEAEEPSSGAKQRWESLVSALMFANDFNAVKDREEPTFDSAKDAASGSSSSSSSSSSSASSSGASSSTSQMSSQFLSASTTSTTSNKPLVLLKQTPGPQSLALMARKRLESHPLRAITLQDQNEKLLRGFFALAQQKEILTKFVKFVHRTEDDTLGVVGNRRAAANYDFFLKLLPFVLPQLANAAAGQRQGAKVNVFNAAKSILRFPVPIKAIEDIKSSSSNTGAALPFYGPHLPVVKQEQADSEEKSVEYGPAPKPDGWKDDADAAESTTTGSSSSGSSSGTSSSSTSGAAAANASSSGTGSPSGGSSASASGVSGGDSEGSAAVSSSSSSNGDDRTDTESLTSSTETLDAFDEPPSPTGVNSRSINLGGAAGSPDDDGEKSRKVSLVQKLSGRPEGSDEGSNNSQEEQEQNNNNNADDADANRKTLLKIGAASLLVIFLAGGFSVVLCRVLATDTSVSNILSDGMDDMLIDDEDEKEKGEYMDDSDGSD
ncbi:unnamed protein product [Amoebophrya sp. A120]|nr:unnamed protein product [Amoebophrya sp. A120]|eukprot:GSA120T00005514001.1